MWLLSSRLEQWRLVQEIWRMTKWVSNYCLGKRKESNKVRNIPLPNFCDLSWFYRKDQKLKMWLTNLFLIWNTVTSSPAQIDYYRRMGMSLRSKSLPNILFKFLPSKIGSLLQMWLLLPLKNMMNKNFFARILGIAILFSSNIIVLLAVSSNSTIVLRRSKSSL